MGSQTRSLCFLLFYVAVAAALVPLSSIPKFSNAPVLPGKFIIEVEDVSQIPSKRDLGFVHERVYDAIRKRGVGFTVQKEFKAQGLFTGAAVTLSNPSDISQVKNIEGVVAVRPIFLTPAPQPVFKHVVTGPNDPQLPPDSESTHIMTGVDKLHAQGISGKGVKIGIIDTGVDWTHPNLGGAIGPGNKIIGGFDFVGDAYNGSNTPMPDSNPLDQCNGHGTHVTGIIGANPGNDFNISGVAFDASITMYRVFGCSGDVSDDVLVEALLRGVTDDQDILTMSLGGESGWTESTTAVLSSRIAATGRVVTIAAGNDGDFGSWYTSSPGNGINAISVASVDNILTPGQNATVHGVASDPIFYLSTFPLNVTGALPVFATSTDTTVVDDACNPLPDSTPDLSKFLTVVRRGTCTFVQKLTNIAAKGGNFVFIYDNGSGLGAIDIGNFTNAVLIPADEGVFLVNEFAAGANITLSFPQVGGAAGISSPTGGLISDFSTYGPTNDMFFKPAVAAPGGNILSTFPVPLGSFAVLSGTSMATPFVAASVALLMSVKGREGSVGLNARTLLETTAMRLPSSNTGGGPPQTLSVQGAGMVSVFNAIHATTIVTPGEFLLNDTAHFKGAQSFTIKNTANTAKVYKISHTPAGTAVSVVSDTLFENPGPVPLTSAAASVRFSATSVLVAPGQSRTVSVNISPPPGIDATTFPVFSGFIDIVSGSDQTHVSYLGVAAALKNKQILDNTDQLFGFNLPAILDANNNPITQPTNFTFVGDDFPTLVTRMTFGTPKLLVDLVRPDIKFTPTFSKRASGGTFAAVPILGNLLEQDFLGRNSDATDAADNVFNTFGLQPAVFANGTSIPDGTYRVLLRVLKVTGDPTNEADFESWLSPVIGVNVH